METSSLPFCLRRGLFIATGGIFLPSVFLLCLRRVAFFQQRKKVTKERRQNAGRNPWFLHFLPGV